MEFNERWEESADRAINRDSKHRNKDLRWCPGVYKPTGEYNDVWTYWFLEHCTPYKTFQELWDSGNVSFSFERYEKGDSYDY